MFISEAQKGDVQSQVNGKERCSFKVKLPSQVSDNERNVHPSQAGDNKRNVHLSVKGNGGVRHKSMTKSGVDSEVEANLRHFYFLNTSTEQS